MGRFLAIVIALVAIALAINYWQKEKPVGGEPKLVEPAKVEEPAETPAQQPTNGENASAPSQHRS